MKRLDSLTKMVSRGRRSLAHVVGAALLVALNPGVGNAQQAEYLQDAIPWQNSTKGISGLWDMQGYLSSSVVPARGRAVKTIDGLPPPMLPWAAQLLEQRLVDAEHDKAFPNSASLCLPQGIPYMLSAAVGGPLQILETPGQVTFISDAYNEMWFIYLNQEHPPKDDIEPTYHGDSVGHWEGDTLVVDSIGFNTATTLDQVGTPHSEDMHVITRIRRLDPQMLEFVITIDDPKTFTKPWSKRQLYKKAGDKARISEVVCENQRNGIDPETGYQSLEFKPAL
jgi:hypothetical protein